MNKEISIGDLLGQFRLTSKYLITKWLTIALISLLGALLGFVYTWQSDSKYTAKLTFVSENESRSTLGGYAGIAAQFGFDIGGGGGSAFEGDNLIELLKSKNLIEQVLLSRMNKNSLIIDEYIKLHNIRLKAPMPRFDIESNHSGTLADSIINIVYDRIIDKHLQVQKIDKKIDFIYIQFTDKDQVFSKTFVENLANKSIEYYTNYKNKKNLNNIRILQKQVDSVRILLFGNINEIASSNDLNINPIKQSLRTNTQRKQVDMQVNSVLYTELLKNLELAKLTLRKESPLIQLIDTPRLPIKNEKMGRLVGFCLFGLVTLFVTVLFFIFKRIISEK